MEDDVKTDKNNTIVGDINNGASLEAGNIKIADDVVAVIAGLAASEVKGVASMSGSIVGDISEFVGKKNPMKGVKVEVGEREAAVDLYVIIEFGLRIPEVALQIQKNVKNAIEKMTGLEVVEININVQGIALPVESRQGNKPLI